MRTGSSKGTGEKRQLPLCFSNQPSSVFTLSEGWTCVK